MRLGQKMVKRGKVGNKGITEKRGQSVWSSNYFFVPITLAIAFLNVIIFVTLFGWSLGNWTMALIIFVVWIGVMIVSKSFFRSDDVYEAAGYSGLFKKGSFRR